MREKLQQLVKETQEEKQAIEDAEFQDYINRMSQILEHKARKGFFSYTIYEYGEKGIYLNPEDQKIFNRPSKVNISLIEELLKKKYPDLSITKFRWGNSEDALRIEWN